MLVDKYYRAQSLGLSARTDSSIDGQVIQETLNFVITHDFWERRWRHLDTCQFRTQVVARVPRVQCPEHGCVTISVPWAEQNSRYTRLFEAFVISWLRAASISAVSKQLRLSWTAIDNIMERVVRRGQALAVEDGKSSDSLGRFYDSLETPCKQSIISISMDMSPAYQKATFAHIEKAHQKIAFDHFHVAQMLTRTLDATRHLAGLSRQRRSCGLAGMDSHGAADESSSFKGAVSGIPEQRKS